MEFSSRPNQNDGKLKQALLVYFLFIVLYKMSIVLSPLVKWAQDRRVLYLTVEISNGVVKKLEIGEKTLNFQGKPIFNSLINGLLEYKLKLRTESNGALENITRF